MKIRSYGCSFLDGSELENPKLTWPARIANTLALEHVNHAEGGSGNFRILHRILENTASKDLCFVNWTYTDRFCYRNWQNETYSTLLPTGDNELSKNYFKNIYGQYHAIFMSLVAIKTAIDFLLCNKNAFIMTFMDHTLLAPVDNWWNNPTAVTGLQNYVRNFLYTWRGKNFIEWAQINQFPISDQYHPLDLAHEAAANFFGKQTEWLLEYPATIPAAYPRTAENASYWTEWQPDLFELPVNYK